MQGLEKLLRMNVEKYPNGILVVTDGVFSMDGDICNLPTIIQIVRKYNALLLIDDAHAIGVIGKNGAGTLSHYNIKENKNIIVTGTLSKAIGTVGGYITASQDIIDYLRIYARSNMFSTSLPPSICAGAIEVIKKMDNSNIVEKLQENTFYMINEFKKAGFNTLNTETPIIPIIVGNEEALDRGYFLNAIYSPAVPANLSRFRISVMASHTKNDMDGLVELMKDLFKKYNIPRYA